MSRASFGRMLVLIGTVVLAWGVLSLGETAGDPELNVGDRAARTFQARRAADVPDAERTQSAKDRAARSVQPILRRDQERETEVFGRLDRIIDGVRAIAAPGPTSAPDVPEPVATTTSVPASDSSEPVEEPVEDVSLEAFVFVDVNGDRLYDSAPVDFWLEDLTLSDIRVVAIDAAGFQYEGETASDGRAEIAVPPGEYTVVVDPSSDGYPDGFSSIEGRLSQEVTCSSDDCAVDEGVALTPNVRPLDERITELDAEAPALSNDTIETLTRFAEEDLFRRIVGETEAIDTIRGTVIDRLGALFTTGVDEEEVEQLSGQVRGDRRLVNIDGASNDEARMAVNDLTAELLNNNLVVDQEQTAAAQLEATDAIEPVTESYRASEVIVTEGEILSELDIAAINETGAFVERNQRRYGMFGMLTVLVAVLAYYLARFRQRFWDRPRMVALLGLLIFIAAASVRVTISVSETTGSVYVIPAVALGYLAAVLFDNRMGTLMALAVAVITAIGTFDPGATVYAGLATLAPVGFVSAVSSRRAFRNSVMIASASAAVIAAAATWFFDTNPSLPAWPQIWPHAAWAGGISLGAALLTLAAMPFFEAMFDVTTTLRLLELTDRNHEALQLIQDKAFGTFNHSLMVGTLADSAARAIGANTLLARAAAYFHDIGKTENPTFFIENQFGIPNPHEELTPEQSAEVIRRHVIDGIELAKRYRIPSDVAEGILAHHGDGIMRYFYETARQSYGADNVDPDLYRHAGHKPRSREMAIVMMADSVEGACRAVFGDEEPTRDSIQKVVNRVVDEKVDDDQLADCNLTFGQLTIVRQAFTDSLIGHYHQRIPYPNFPGD